MSTEASTTLSPIYGRPTRRVWLALLLVGAASAAPGCGLFALSYASGMRTATIEVELDRYVFSQPITEVWAAAETVRPQAEESDLLQLRQFWDRTGPYRMSTSVERSSSKGGGERVDTKQWYEAEGAEVAGGCTVRYFVVVIEATFRNGVDAGTRRSRERATWLELELIRKFDPESAARIEQKGEQAYRKALED
jgi:hypothetical protein